MPCYDIEMLLHLQINHWHKKPLLLIGITILLAIGGIATITARHESQLRLPSPPLKALAARHDIELGNFAIADRIGAPKYNQILTTQFNVALIDNTPNWYFTYGGLRPTPTTYDFSQMDQIVAYAQAHHMTIQAHHLLWGEEKWLPNWLKNSNYTREKLINIIHSDISTVVGHYTGKIGEWSVVNEAFTRAQHINGLHDWWADHTGESAYIAQAFIWAHQADPNAKLILNDFDNETQNSVSDAMYNYIKSARTAGVPIDGIGMQMHIDGTSPPSKQAVISNMRRFANLGVGVYITEFDVNMSDVHASDARKDQVEADIYYNMMRACIESKVCRSFSELGITDNETWYNYMGPSSADARPLMFDYNYNPKPAFYAFRTALQQP